MKTRRIRRGATNTTTITIVVIVVVLVGLLVVGCFGAILGLMMPALGKARENAQMVRSGAQLRQIEMTYQIWHRQAEPDEPFSFDMLVAEDYATPELFVSPFGPAPDGGEDYWFLHPRPDAAEPDAADIVVGYDRAMYATHRNVAVLFGDRTVDYLDVAEFQRLLGAPLNDEVDFNLPQRPNSR